MPEKQTARTAARRCTQQCKALKNGVVIAVAFIHCCILGAVLQSGYLSTIAQAISGGGLLIHTFTYIFLTLSSALWSILILKVLRRWIRNTPVISNRPHQVLP